MTAKQEVTGYRSFLLRLWREDEADATAVWRGEIESIQTGQKWQFADLTTMADFLKKQVLGGPATDSDQKND